MNRLSLIGIALAGVLAGGLALAQPGPRPDPEARLQNLTVLLELDPTQQATLRTLFERQREQMQERREQHRQAREGKREAMRAEREQHRDAFKQELSTVLSPQQMQKFEALMAEHQAMRQRMHARRRGEDGPGPGRE